MRDLKKYFFIYVKIIKSVIYIFKMYEDYEDNEIGALDCEEIEGYVPETSNILLQYAEEFKTNQKREQLDQDAITNKIKQHNQMESEDEEELIDIKIPEKEKWDCESILSTYSNLYNHPKLISEPKVSNLVLIVCELFYKYT